MHSALTFFSFLPLAIAIFVFIFSIVSNPQCFGANTATVEKKGEVLSPQRFSGRIADGYRAAQANKEICSKLFCYCGCDFTDKHTSLLDCFTSMHGVDCSICLDEAIIARHLKGLGKSLAEIQDTIDEGFTPQYPWDEPTPALNHYLQVVKIHKKNLDAPNNSINQNRSTKAPGKAKHIGKCCH